jgi:hypothetical protein
VYDLDGAGHAKPAAAERQALSRIVNERIAQLSQALGAPVPAFTFVCECGNDGCSERLELTKGEWEAVRAKPLRFVLLPGHENAAAGRVVERRDGHVVTERGRSPDGKPAPDTRFGARLVLAHDSAPARPQSDELLAELEQARTRNEQLEIALQSRIVIEQAKGILAERFGWSIEAAFEILRSGARSARMNIHQLARDVVACGATPQPIEAALARRRHSEHSR